MRDLIIRAMVAYRSGGASTLFTAAHDFVASGELRYRLIGLLPGTIALVRLWIAVGRSIQPRRYTDAEPFQILWVDPERINKSISGQHYRLRRFGRVFGGEWDHDTEDFEDHHIYRSLFRHFRDGVAWEETEYYRNIIGLISRGDRTRAGTSVNEVHNYFTEIDELYDAIANDGYRTQPEMLRTAPLKTRIKNMDAPVPEMNEIGVCIGRDGSLIFRYRGRHRLTIAKILPTDTVAIQILARHRKWQRIREEFRMAASITDVRPEWREFRTHPDLWEFEMEG